MPVGVDRLGADDADRPAGAHDLRGSLGECTGGADGNSRPSSSVGSASLYASMTTRAVVGVKHSLTPPLSQPDPGT